MNDLLAAIGDWIDSRIKHRGMIYKIVVGAMFLALAIVIVRDITNMFRGTE